MKNPLLTVATRFLMKEDNRLVNVGPEEELESILNGAIMAVQAYARVHVEPELQAAYMEGIGISIAENLKNPPVNEGNLH